MEDEGTDAGMGAEEDGEYNEDVEAMGDEPGEEGQEAAADDDLEDTPALAGQEEVGADQAATPQVTASEIAEAVHAHTAVAAIKASDASSQPAPAAEAPAPASTQQPALTSPAAAKGPATASSRPAPRVRPAPPPLSAPGVATSPPSQPTKAGVVVPTPAVDSSVVSEAAAVSPPRRRERNKIDFNLPTKAKRDPTTGAAAPTKPATAPAAPRSYTLVSPHMMPPLHMPGSGSSLAGVQPFPHPATVGTSGASASYHSLQHPASVGAQAGLQVPIEQAALLPEGQPPVPAPGLAARMLRGALAGRNGPGGRMTARGNARGRGAQ